LKKIEKRSQQKCEFNTVSWQSCRRGVPIKKLKNKNWINHRF
jgi:hypothetical protein